jgi:hypothetical protein
MRPNLRRSDVVACIVPSDLNQSNNQLKEGDYFLIMAFPHRPLQAGVINAQLKTWRNLRPF